METISHWNLFTTGRRWKPRNFAV